MNKQPRMIDADKAIKMIDEAIKNSNENRDECMPVWSRGEVNGLSVAKGIILSGQCDVDPIPLPTIKPIEEALRTYLHTTIDVMTHEQRKSVAMNLGLELIPNE